MGKRLVHPLKSYVSSAYPARNRPRLSTVRHNFLYTKRELEALRVANSLYGVNTPAWLFSDKDGRKAGEVYDKESWEKLIEYSDYIGNIGYDIDTDTLWQLISVENGEAVWKEIPVVRIIQPYTFVQEESAIVWEVHHPLDRYPTVTPVLISDDNSRELIYGDVRFITKSYLTISFIIPVAGEVYLL